MIGLAVLAGIAIYIAVWWLLVSSLKRTWAKAAAIVIALAIPFWDLPLGYSSFTGHCREEGGLHQLGRVAANEGVFFSYGTGVKAEYLFGLGAHFVEYLRPDESVTRYSRLTNGSIEKTTVDKPSSPVRLQAKFNVELPWNIYKNEVVLWDVQSNRPLARATSFYWIGGWIQRGSMPLLVMRESCDVQSLDQMVSLAVTGSPK